MKGKSRIRRLFAVVSAAVMMMCGGLGFIPITKTGIIAELTSAEAAASDHTADDAINWVKSKNGTYLGGECVELINQYMNYLGVNYRNYLVQKASDFSQARYCPSGWAQIKGASPQKGDVLVYSGNPGHVAIYESDYSTWHQNYGVTEAEKKKVRNITNKKYNETGNYWGVLRPNFKEAYPAPANIGDNMWAMILQTDSLKPIVTNPGGKVVLGESENSDKTAGYWHLYRQDDGSYRIQSYCNNMFLSVDRDADENGAAICMNEWAGGVSQDWWIYQSGDKYKFRPNTSSDKVIDIDSNSQADGAKVQIWHDEDAPQQWLYIVNVDPINLGDSFIAEITQEKSGKPIVPNKNGAVVLGASQNSDASAKWWRFTRHEGNTYSVQSFLSGEFLVVPDQSNENGAIVKTKSWDGSSTHDWKIYNFGSSVFLTPAYSFKSLDIDSASVSDGTKVQIWNSENTGSQNIRINKITPQNYGNDFYAVIKQKKSGKPIVVNPSDQLVLGESQNSSKDAKYWHFVKCDNNAYMIESCYNQKYVDITGKKDENGARLMTGKKDNQASQKWYIYDFGSQITLVPVLSESQKGLDIDSGSTEDGTIVHLWNVCKSETQAIVIEKIDPKKIFVTLGDVNDDGSIDLKDVTFMRRALAGWDVTVNEAAADVNKDGSFDLKDVVILRRYLAGGWDIEL